LISNKQEFTDSLLTDLYDRFFDTGRHLGQLQETSGQFEQAIDRVLKQVTNASSDAKSFGQTLNAYTAELGDDLSIEKVRGIVTNLLTETQQTVERNRALEERLMRSSGEISELKESLEVVRKEALTDALTGIPNRKFFDTRLKEATRSSMEDGEPLSLLLLDIDHFKQFNDTYGHQLGDQVLRLVARTLTDSVKGRDTPARYGGEEFVIILPQTRLPNAVTVAEQIRRTMVRHKVVRKDSGEEYGVITLSIGASTYRPGEALADLIKRADAALYHAKRTGRNRVIAEDDVPPEVLAEAIAAQTG
jgi:diguanylate cyclase